MKYLAIDYGRSHLGLAISEGFIAEPYDKFKNQSFDKTQDKNSKIKDASQKLKVIKEIVNEEKIQQIIIGISEGEMAEETKKFGEGLKKITGLSVEYQDETLTSKEAIKKMIESGKKRSDRQTKEHNFAACLILQSYLDNLT